MFHQNLLVLALVLLQPYPHPHHNQDIYNIKNHNMEIEKVLKN